MSIRQHTILTDKSTAPLLSAEIAHLNTQTPQANAESAQSNSQIEHLQDLQEQRVSASSRNRNLIMKLYMATGLAKIEGVSEYVGDLLESGAKFLVFAHHQQVSSRRWQGAVKALLRLY